MRRNLVSLLIILPILTTLIGIPIFEGSATLPVVKDEDILAYGYTLVANATTIETKTESNPVKKQVLLGFTKPEGLYYELIGMRLGEVKNAIITPDLGFLPSDSEYGHLAGLTLYYNNLKVYEINGYHISEIPTNGLSPGSFGYIFIRIIIALVSVAGAGLLGYGIYRYYPKLFGKKCTVCKSVAIGSCKKCGEVYCDKCYSNGCPKCKSRTLIRFK